MFAKKKILFFLFLCKGRGKKSPFLSGKLKVFHLFCILTLFFMYNNTQEALLLLNIIHNTKSRRNEYFIHFSIANYVYMSSKQSVEVKNANKKKILNLACMSIFCRGQHSNRKNK